LLSLIADCCRILSGIVAAPAAVKEPRAETVWADKEDTSETLRQWTVEDKIVSLVQVTRWRQAVTVPADPRHPPRTYRMSDRLKCVVEDRQARKTWDIGLYGKAEEILQRMPIVEQDGSVTFAKPIHSWPLSRNIEIILLKRGEIMQRKGFTLLKCDLVWYAFNTSSNTAQVDPINFPQSISREDHVYYALAHKLAVQSPGYAMQAVQGKSLMDPSMTLEGHRWAVTFVDTAVSNSNPYSWFGHAAIVIEGIKKNGLYFMSVVHMRENRFSKEAEVVYLDENDITPEEVRSRCKEKTRSWQRSASQAAKLIKRVKWEIQMQAEGRPQVFFHIRGSHAAGVKPRKAAEYQSHEEWERSADSVPGKEMEQHFTESFFRPSNKKNDSCPSIDDEEFWRKYGEQNPYCRFVKQNPKTQKFEEFIMPDNCTTWAIKRLYLAGISLPPGSNSRIATGPHDYTRAKEPLTPWEDWKDPNPLPSLLAPIEEHNMAMTFQADGPRVRFTQEPNLFE